MPEQEPQNARPQNEGPQGAEAQGAEARSAGPHGEHAPSDGPQTDGPQTEHPQTDAKKPRRRQARGERRVAQLLQAAASVFCRTGYSAASTNAIAREAGVSPGTLYQFFPNKEAIALELGGRLLEDWRASNGQALAPENIALPLSEMLDAVIDPLLDFKTANPAFHVLMHGPDAPGELTAGFETVHGAVLAQIEQLLALYLPDTPGTERARVANTVLALFKAGLDLIAAHEDEREAYSAELKKVLFRYLDPVIGDKVLDPTAPVPTASPAPPSSPS
ncbi:TetR/AcrR family transcriptional regulator [Streptomyces sp. TE33382]